MNNWDEIIHGFVESFEIFKAVLITIVDVVQFLIRAFADFQYYVNLVFNTIGEAITYVAKPLDMIFIRVSSGLKMLAHSVRGEWSLVEEEAKNMEIILDASATAFDEKAEGYRNNVVLAEKARDGMKGFADSLDVVKNALASVTVNEQAAIDAGKKYLTLTKEQAKDKSLLDQLNLTAKLS